MRGKTIRRLSLLASLLFLLVWTWGCDGDDEDDQVLSAIMEIFYLDLTPNGAPDTYQYRIKISGPAEDRDLDHDPLIELPNGTLLPAPCAESGDQIVCVTALQTPPAPSGKADIPVGTYQVQGEHDAILEFEVTAADLAAADPAYADAASLVPAPGPLADPAALDWDTVTPGPAGRAWEFRIENADGADDDGQVVKGRSDWATSDLSLDLPDSWDSADPLLIEINAVANSDRGDYLQVIKVQVVVTGYTKL